MANSEKSPSINTFANEKFFHSVTYGSILIALSVPEKGRSAGSLSEQRLVLEPTNVKVEATLTTSMEVSLYFW